MRMSSRMQEQAKKSGMLAWALPPSLSPFMALLPCIHLTCHMPCSRCLAERSILGQGQSEARARAAALEDKVMLHLLASCHKLSAILSASVWDQSKMPART